MPENPLQDVADVEFGDSIKGFVEDDGDLVFEGLAVPITVDDEDERFEEKALSAAIEEFMAGDRPLLYHHKGDMPLGTVENLEHRPGEGLWMKARVVQPEPGTEAADVFNKVKRGVIRGISCGARMWRRPEEGTKAGDPLAAKWRIWKTRFREFSLTPIPVHPQALGAVAQKAFAELDAEALAGLTEQERRDIGDAVSRYRGAIKRLQTIGDARRAASERADDNSGD